jgi:hypothetical protein
MKISTVIDNIGPSQNSFYLIKEFNKLTKDVNNSCSVFINRITSPVTKPLFPCLSIAFFQEYSGTVIATTLKEAETVLKTSNNTEKYLYLWEMEWLTGAINHKTACDIMKNFKIIARSDSHAKVIKNFSNIEPVGIVDDWNIKQLLNIVEGVNV